MLAPASACKGRDARPRGATLGLRFDRASPPRNRILYETVAALTTASVTASSSRAFNPITYAACKGHDAPRSRPIAEDSPTGRARHDPWPTPKQTPIGRGSRQRPCRFVCLRSCRIGPSNTELSCEAPLCSASSASTLCWTASRFRRVLALDPDAYAIVFEDVCIAQGPLERSTKRRRCAVSRLELVVVS